MLKLLKLSPFTTCQYREPSEYVLALTALSTRIGTAEFYAHQREIAHFQFS